jgi:hypothetical protein
MFADPGTPDIKNNKFSNPLPDDNRMVPDKPCLLSQTSMPKEWHSTGTVEENCQCPEILTGFCLFFRYYPNY